MSLGLGGEGYLAEGRNAEWVVEVKDRAFFSTACEDGLCVGKGWIICIGIRQLSKCV